MEALKALKRSLGGHKGQFKIALMSYNSIVAVTPLPTYTALEQAYSKVCNRIESTFTACDSIMTMLCECTDKNIDVDAENKEVETYMETLINERSKIESSFVELQTKYKSTEVVAETVAPAPKTDTKPRVRVASISVPPWNGNKADFYTWKQKFLHIMKEAGYTDDLTQVCYLQEKDTLPSEYQSLITDCTDMNEAWDRLQERIPKDTIKFEVIGQFRNLQSLSEDRSPAQLRDFANEISMFCRRMSDLGLTEENYNCIAMQDIYDRLDPTTTLNYLSRNELKRELGQPANEDIKSLCSFIRSEATTLELAGSTKSAKKVNFLHNTDLDDKQKVGKAKCQLGCPIKHRFIECEQYMEKTTEQHIKVLRVMSRCFICLGVGHVADTCTRKNDNNWLCRLCSQQNHHWTVCSTKPSESNLNVNATLFEQKNNSCTNIEPSIACECDTQTAVNSMNHKKAKDYSPVVLVEVLTSPGVWKNAKCLLDGGSNWSLVRTGFTESAELEDIGPSTARFGVAGGGVHNEEGIVHDFNIRIRGKGRTDAYNIIATGIRKPCFDTPRISPSTFTENPHLQEEKSTIYVNGGEIDILIGSDYGCLIQSEGNTRAATDPDNHPSIAHTRLGNHLYSGLSPQTRNVNNHEIQLNYIKAVEEIQLNKFFYNDILGVKPTSMCVCSDKEVAEAAFIKHVKQTTHINSDGRVSTAIPWKPGFPENLPNNYERAYDVMMKMENRLEKEELEIHNELIQELLNNRFVRILNSEETSNAQQEPGWYLNTNVVERPDKTSTKFRLVFNSAAKYKGVCLNDAMEKGPDYLNSMFSCFIKWRKDAVAINGDIKKMFNQVVLAEKDRRYHRFLWRFGNKDSDVFIFEWERLLFGDKGSPDLAASAIKLLADENKHTLPLGSDILNTSTYVDDITHSEPNDERAINAMEETDSILSKGKFIIKTWNSNSVTVNCNPEMIVDILGHQWNKNTDTIILRFKDLENVDQFTKRAALKCSSKCWDLAGLPFPVIIKYRIDLQRIWLEGYGWDEILPSDHQEIWQSNLKEMQSLEIEINRCLRPAGTIGLPQIHAFADAGDHAYGACVFIRWKTTEGIYVKLVSSKAFVAPLKQKTTPRLELMGAIAMSRLTTMILSALNFEIEFKKFWIDSEIVLWWLMSQSCKFKPFVSTRIQEFQDAHSNWKEEINYVPSEINPADCLTKPIDIEHLKPWQDGKFHNFFSLPTEQFPKQPDFQTVKPQLPPSLFEEKAVTKITQGKRRRTVNNIHAFAVMDRQENPTFDEQIALNFSSWNKLVRSLAYLLQSLRNESFPTQVCLTPQELSTSQSMLFLICQRTLQNDINETKQRFHKFSLVEDPSGVIRVQGRLEKSSLPDEVKNPILLPGEHPITRLLAIHHHRLLLHQGYRVVLANLANLGIMIGSGMELLKSIASRCLFCRIRRRKLLEQRMGQLPNFRVQVRMPPFTSVALDFFGNLKIKLTKNSSVNGLVMIVTCCTTRCIHLELCLALDTGTFLKAWRRFVSTRGVHPHLAFSDNGGAFQGAHQMISDWIMEWDRELIEREMANNGTKFDFDWEFNVPTASHMNGVVESLINSVRKGLDATIINYTKTSLTFEDWATVLSEITYVINSRPLFPDGDPLEMSCITGNSLLHPHGQPQVPQLVPSEPTNLRDMLRVVQGKTDVFWETWIRHMPPQLICRNKWFHTRNNLEVGDFVINLEPGMKGKCAPRSQWKKGIVTAVHPGADGLVRSVTIRDANRTELVRPIHKLCLIATRGELEEDD